MKNLLILCSFILFCSCSVENVGVFNQPPVTPNQKISFDEEYKTIRPESASVFLWPNEKFSEAEMIQIKQTVTEGSMKYDRLIKGADTLGAEMAGLMQKSVELGCEELSEEDKNYQKCQLYSSRVLEIYGEVEGIQPQLEEINLNTRKSVDPGYPTKVKNWLVDSSKGVKFDLIEGGDVSCEVTLKKFGREEIDYDSRDRDFRKPRGKITNCEYSPVTKLIKFELVEAKKVVECQTETQSRQTQTDEECELLGGLPQIKLEETGGIFAFKLERSVFLPRSRLSGSVKYKVNGEIKRHGRAKFDEAGFSFVSDRWGF